MKVSVIIPVYNEEESLPELYRELQTVFDREPLEGEFIMVDDGSTDRSAEEIVRIGKLDSRVRFVRFARNFGQTAAFRDGVYDTTPLWKAGMLALALIAGWLGVLAFVTWRRRPTPFAALAAWDETGRSTPVGKEAQPASPRNRKNGR